MSENKSILVGGLCALALMVAFYLLVAFICPSDRWCGSDPDPEADAYYDQWVDWY